MTDHDHEKYITTSEFNNLTTENFKARLAQANLATKADFDTRLISLNKKINSNKTKHLIVENELKKFKKFDLSYFRGKNYFGDDGTQNYVKLQTMNKYIKKTGSTDNISSWKSKELSDEIFKFPSKYDNSCALKLIYAGLEAKLLLVEVV